MASRRAVLTAALGFARLEGDAPELRPLRAWLESWRGLGAVVVGMARQGYRLHLTNIDEHVWRATFSRAAGLAQNGFGAAPTPWGAVQRAAWGVLGQRAGEK